MNSQNKHNYSDNDIKTIADNCRNQYISAMGWQNSSEYFLNINEIYESVIYPQYEYSLETDQSLGDLDSQKILGKTIPDLKVILLDISLKKDSRRTFTFGHEIGHAVLHNQQGQYYRCTVSTIFNVNNRAEVEANKFIQYLIMPDGLVKYRYVQYFGDRPILYIGEGYYYLNNKKIYINSLAHLYSKIAEPLTHCFADISKQSLAYQLEHIGVVNNKTHETLDYVKEIKMLHPLREQNLRRFRGG